MFFQTYYGRIGGTWVAVWSHAAPAGLPLTSGLTGSCALRRTGQLVEVTFNVEGSIPSGNVALTPNAAIEQDLRPATNRRGPAFIGGLATGGAYVTAGGLVGVRNDTGAARGSADGSVLYILG